MENQRSSKKELPSSLQTLNGLIKHMNIDITENILSRIPIEFVSNSRSVCKLWRSILPKPKSSFLFTVCESEIPYEEIQLFHGYSEEVSNVAAPVSYKTLARLDLGLGISRNASAKLLHNNGNPVIYGSCNGLVCCAVRTDDVMRCVVYVCNPMTGEYVYLPEINFGEVSVSSVFGGFGYCRSTNEYKVVQFTNEYHNRDEVAMIHVYTLGGGNGWRNKGVARDVRCNRLALAYANDAFYWLECPDDVWKLNVFVLADETFGSLRMPPCHDGVRGYRRVVSLSGFLCLYHVTLLRCVQSEEEDYTREEDTRIEVWVLTKEQKKTKNVSSYPVDEDDDSNPWVWSKEFSMGYRSQFPDHVVYEPFAITDCNQVLMWENWEILSFKGLVRFDRDGDTASRKILWDGTFGSSQAFPHMKSFVSLKDLGEESARYIPNDNELMHRSQRV